MNTTCKHDWRYNPSKDTFSTKCRFCKKCKSLEIKSYRVDKELLSSSSWNYDPSSYMISSWDQIPFYDEENLTKHADTLISSKLFIVRDEYSKEFFKRFRKHLNKHRVLSFNLMLEPYG